MADAERRAATVRLLGQGAAARGRHKELRGICSQTVSQKSCPGSVTAAPLLALLAAKVLLCCAQGRAVSLLSMFLRRPLLAAHTATATAPQALPPLLTVQLIAK